MPPMFPPLKIGNSSFNGERTAIVGIINATPDSFSDGGAWPTLDDQLRCAEAMISSGADIIDIGGMSSRPGAQTISLAEEMTRVLPFLEAYPQRFTTPLSIDTWRSEVADVALQNGAQIVNDISGFRADPQMAPLIGKWQAIAIGMHLFGHPATTHNHPPSTDIMSDIQHGFDDMVETARRHGFGGLILDPGIGFGKSLDQNLQILRSLHQFTTQGHAILIGISRKSFIGRITAAEPTDRLWGTIAANTIAILNGATFIRVHDVREAKQATLVVDAIRNPHLEGVNS